MEQKINLPVLAELHPTAIGALESANRRPLNANRRSWPDRSGTSLAHFEAVRGYEITRQLTPATRGLFVNCVV